ncbi:MAG TPA: coiled-coil protein [Candidatus Thermoplasmatota archaeon]|nr:coiled-coil protein [Candidatus Thermoplasmatota archaeon]
MTEGESDVLIEDFLDKKERLNQQANRHRDLRDRMNEETKRWAARRDELNAKVRGLIDQANQHKARRDELNRNVMAAKQQRDELNKVANEKADALNLLKKDRSPREGPTPGKLKAEIRRLEFEQQTKVMTPKKEKELIDRIGALLKELRAIETSYEADAGVKEAYEAMKTAKAAAEEQHRAVTELANAAQEQHDKMVALFEEADKYRREADGGQEKFIESKMGADKVHHEYIDMVNQIRDLEKVVNGLRGKDRRGRGETAAVAAKAEGDAIFEKFKKGEKLSTEDLMALQKAGLL